MRVAGMIPLHQNRMSGLPPLGLSEPGAARRHPET